MKIAKEFTWEMGHRLTFYKGKCQYPHGHSYKMLLEIDAEINENGMILDYYEIDSLVKPVIEKLDHSFIVYKKDTGLIDALKSINSNLVIIETESTAENICKYLLEKISNITFPVRLNKIKIRVYETTLSYAEEEISFYSTNS